MLIFIQTAQGSFSVYLMPGVFSGWYFIMEQQSPDFNVLEIKITNYVLIIIVFSNNCNTT